MISWFISFTLILFSVVLAILILTSLFFLILMHPRAFLVGSIVIIIVIDVAMIHSIL